MIVSFHFERVVFHWTMTMLERVIHQITSPALPIVELLRPPGPSAGPSRPSHGNHRWRPSVWFGNTRTLGDPMVACFLLTRKNRMQKLKKQLYNIIWKELERYVCHYIYIYIHIHWSFWMKVGDQLVACWFITKSQFHGVTTLFLPSYLITPKHLFETNTQGWTKFSTAKKEGSLPCSVFQG